MYRITSMMIAVGMLTTSHATRAGENGGSLFLKLPVTSFHFGDTGGYSFNQKNFGFGIGYEHRENLLGLGDISFGYSMARFTDSYHCPALNLQVRALKEYEVFAFGVSLNLAHKCVRPHTEGKTFATPLFTSSWDLDRSVRMTVDGFPPITKQNGVGFIGVSLELPF